MISFSAFVDEMEKLATSQARKEWAAAQHGTTPEIHGAAIEFRRQVRRMRLPLDMQREDSPRLDNLLMSHDRHNIYRVTKQHSDRRASKKQARLEKMRDAGTPKQPSPPPSPAARPKKGLTTGKKVGIGLAAAGALGAGAYAYKKHKEKNAGFLRDAAMPWVGKHSREVVSNLAETAGAFARPMSSLRQGWHETAASMNPRGNFGQKANLALMVAGTGLGVPGVIAKQDNSGRGRSRLNRAAGFVGGQIGGIMGTPFGLTGGIAGGIAGEAIGSRVGNLIDRARGIPVNKHAPAAAIAQPQVARLTTARPTPAPAPAVPVASGAIA